MNLFCSAAETGDKGDNWIQKQIDIEVDIQHQIVLEVVRANKRNASDVAIDDVTFDIGSDCEGECLLCAVQTADE